MDVGRNIIPITFEPTEDLITEAYETDDFSAVDAAIARNTVKEQNMVSQLVNGVMDSFCWASGNLVSHMLSRTSHPGYTLQLTDFVRGQAAWDIDIRHAGELTLPDGVCVVGVENANYGVEDELAEHFGIYLTQEAFERYGHEIACAGNHEASREAGREDVPEIAGCDR